MASRFSELVVSHLKTENKLDDAAIGVLLATYEHFLTSIVGLPAPEAATVEDIIAFDARNRMSSTQTWVEFKAVALADHQSSQDQNDIFQPIWNGKTDDRTTPWTLDTAAVPFGTTTATVNRSTIEAVAKVLRAASPSMDVVSRRRLRSPVNCRFAMQDVVDGMLNVVPLFIRQLGTGDNISWRYGPALAMLGGLGLEWVRYVAQSLDNNEGMGHLASLNDEELTEEVVGARNTSGYPVGLLRCDFTDLYHAMRGEPVPPRWFQAIVAMHILKHCRIEYDTDDGYNSLFIAYKGRHGIVQYQKAGHHQPINSPMNKNLQVTLKNLLRLPTSTPRNPSPWADDVTAVLSALTPSLLIASRNLRSRPEIVPAKGVKFSMDSNLTKSYQFINPGIVVRNCAVVDVDSGAVDKNAQIGGSDVLTYAWPRELAEATDLDQWRFNLPDTIPAVLPSTVIFTMLRNINFLGEEKAVRAMVDGIIATGLVRDMIGGCPIGSAVRDEYPLVFAYPMGHTMDTTTNQGKTNLCRIMARIFVPSFPAARSSNRSDSAPVQRTLAYDILKYGTAVYDEFILPYSISHFLSKESLQNMATGGMASPGEAMGNSPGVKLKYPLFFTAKVSALPADLRNRQFAVFMEQITDATKLSDELLTMVSSGQLPMLARLGMLMYIHKHKIIDKIRALHPIGGIWRFPGHMAVVNLFAGGDKDCIARYLKKTEIQCDKQRSEADESGLADELGVNAQFTLEYYWSEALEMTIDSLHIASSMMERSGAGLSTLDVIKALIEDGGRRNFESAVRQLHMKEPTMVSKVVEELRRKPLERQNWRLRMLTDAETTLKDKHGRKKAQFRLERVVAPTPAPAPAPAPTKHNT